MKKIIFIYLLSIVFISHAQIGINNTPDGTERAALIITNKNNKALGKLTNGQIITDGMILVSDSNGTATWKSADILKMPTITGVFGQGITKDITTRLETYEHSRKFLTNASITLPPGEWAVTIQMNMEIKLISRNNNTEAFIESKLNRDQAFWIRTTFVDSNVSETQQNLMGPTPDIQSTNLASGEMIGNEPNVTIKGEMYIKNSTNAPKQYNLMTYIEPQVDFPYEYSLKGCRIINFAAGSEANGIDKIYAVKYR